MSQPENDKSVPVAIIGMGCLFPKAGSLRDYWANIKGKVDGIGDVPATHWNCEDYFDKDPKKPDFTYARRGGFLSPVEFDPAEFGLAPNTLEATDPAQLLGLLVAQAALRDAGYGPEKEFDRSDVSVILGVTGTLELAIPLGARLGHPIWRRALKECGIEGERAEAVVERISDEYVGWQENSFPGLLGNVVAGRIANRFNLGGANCVVDAACASSLGAMNLAGLELASRRSKMVVTGGVDAFNDIFMFMCFSKTPALSPSGESRPFDKTADGTALGEGVGMVVLKRLDDAEKDGDRIYAVIKGIGASSDGRGKAIYAPSAEGQTRAIRRACETAGVTPDTIELVEAHGTGTVAGDAAEVAGLSEVYREAKSAGTWCALGSVKSQIGHTKAAAGSAGIIKAALALSSKVLPPTMKVTEPIGPVAPGAGPFYVNIEKRPWVRGSHPRRAAVSALGFGGSNFHAVLEEYSPSKSAPDWSGEVQIAAFSGASVEAVSAAVSSFPASGEPSWEDMRRACAATRESFSSSAPHRLLIVLERGKTQARKISGAAVAALKANAGRPSWSLPEGVFFGSGTPGGLAVLFPGQGSQYVGMGRDLACQFPKALEALESADRAFPKGEVRLSDLIYPQPAFQAEEKAAQEAALRDTRAAQPALGAAGLGAWRILADFGVKAEAFAGHSYGELVALCAAGRLEASELFRLSVRRGQLMAQGDGGRGGMLAVQAPLPEIEGILREEGLGLALANKNAPSQGVLSGPKEEIARAAEIFSKRGLRAVVLPVSAAFHSPLVAPAQAPFREALDGLGLKRGQVPVYANKTASTYPEDADRFREILSSQLASPVEFAAMVSAMHAAGARTFLEVGAGSRLTGLVGQILGDRDHAAFPLDSSGGKRSGVTDLARTLSQIAALGHAVDLRSWDGGTAALPPVRKARLSVKITGAPYRGPRSSKPKPVPPPPAAPVKETKIPDYGTNRKTPILATETGADSGALRALQDGMSALQRMQEQTALIHAQFLRGQEAAQLNLQKLILQQERMLSGLPVESSALVVRGHTTEVVSPPHPSAPVPSVAVIEAAGSADGLDSPPRGGAVPSSGGPSSVSSDPTPILLAIVSEKTGYPAETLGLDMDLESDLGIDSIKRVEILSAVSERIPGAPAVKPEHLGTLRTLRHVVSFVSSVSSQAAGSAGGPDSPPRGGAVPSLGGPSISVLTRSVPEAVSVPPASARRPVPIPAASRILIADDGSELARKLSREFNERGHKAELVKPGSAAIPTAPVGGLVILSPSGANGWTPASESFLKSSFTLAQAAAPALRAGGRTLFRTVTRLDGAFGFSGKPWDGQDPIMGGLAGLAKTAAHEWPEVDCRAIDLDPSWSLRGEAAAVLADEILFEGPLETGLGPEGPRAVELRPGAAESISVESLSPGDVVIVTGGARGVTAETAVSTARAFKTTMVLAGRSRLEAEGPEFAGLETEGEIQRAVRAAPGGESLAPRQLKERAQAVLAAREARETLARIEELGVRAAYVACDVRRPGDIAALIAAARRHGPVRGLVHGAGVLADKLIAEKPLPLMEAVLDTKLASLRHLLQALGSEPLKVLALFSSTTARLGRKGQGDYAMANEALNKIAAREASRRPGCKVVSFNWGPWEGGMVTPSLRPIFAREGVGLIGLKEGADFFVSEISSSSRSVEVVVLGQSPAAAVPAAAASETFPAFTREISVKEYPFLQSHVLNGHPVVPAAFLIEWLAHAAAQGNPGLSFHGLEDFRIFKGVRLLNGGSVSVELRTGSPRRVGNSFHVRAEVRGVPEDVLHAAAVVILGEGSPAVETPRGVMPSGEYPRPFKAVYRDFLFHGEDLRGIVAVPALSQEGIVVESKAAPPPEAWYRRPLRDCWTADPMALDSAFQAMILWTWERLGAASLPASAVRYRQFRARFPESGTKIVCRVTRSGKNLAAADIEFLDVQGGLVARMEGYECTVDGGLAVAFKKTEINLVS